MSDTINRPPVSDPFGGGMQLQDLAVATHRESFPTGMAPMGHSAVDQAQAAIVLAQRVPVKRNLPAVLQEVRAIASAGGKEFFYSIPFKDGDRTTRVEGLTIGGAMMAMGQYGNCKVSCLPVRETAGHWTFVAQFDDYEKGVSVLRSFQQRRGQNTGMRDGGRQEDIVFQIGQSKAIRNVIVAALGWLCDEALTAARSGVLDRIGRNPEEARKYLVTQISGLEVALSRVERVVGRAAPNWLAQDMAKIFAELQSIRDGLSHVDELWPRPEPAGGQASHINAAAQPQPAQAAAEPKPRQARKTAEDKPKPTEAPRETPREDTLDADAAFLGGQDAQTHGSQELDADAAKLEGLGQDPGPTTGTDPSDDELRFE